MERATAEANEARRSNQQPRYLSILSIVYPTSQDAANLAAYKRSSRANSRKFPSSRHHIFN